MPSTGPWRRRKDKDTWHWCTNCSNWPKDGTDFVTSHTKPTTGEQDNECKDKQQDGRCN